MHPEYLTFDSNYNGQEVLWMITLSAAERFLWILNLQDLSALRWITIDLYHEAAFIEHTEIFIKNKNKFYYGATLQKPFVENFMFVINDEFDMPYIDTF